MTDAADPTTAPLEDGLAPTHRFRCSACANLTRFDVVTTERTRRFHHLELGGAGTIEEEEVIDRTVESVTCRWCGRDDAIVVERREGVVERREGVVERREGAVE